MGLRMGLLRRKRGNDGFGGSRMQLATTWRTVCAVAVASLAAACGNLGQPEDAQAIDAIGFNAPVAVSAQTNTLYAADPLLPDQPNTLFLIFLTEAGALEPVAAADRPPWWVFKPVAGGAAGDQITLPIAHRKISGRTETRQWTEGPSKLFGETINYTVEVDPNVKGLTTRSFGPFSFRLVLVNDPAVGHWTVRSPGGFDTPIAALDTPQVLNAVAQQSRASVNDFQQRIGAAKQQSYGAIQKALQDNGVLMRSTKAPNVLLSPRAHLAFYIQPNDQAAGALGDYLAYCRAVRVPGYGPWRLASQAELTAVTEMREQGLRTLIDTPDRRLWGAISAPPDQGSVMIPTSTMMDNSGALYDIASPPAEAYGTSLQIFDLTNQGLFQSNGVSISVNTIRGDQLIGVTYQRPSRTFCVATLGT
jgi:hypothetical protein